MVSTYKIERYEISQDRERMGIACFETLRSGSNRGWNYETS